MYRRWKKLSKPRIENMRNHFILKKKNNKSKIEQLEISGHFLKEKKENKGKIESKWKKKWIID